jgi:hypothetical protein
MISARSNTIRNTITRSSAERRESACRHFRLVIRAATTIEGGGYRYCRRA